MPVAGHLQEVLCSKPSAPSLGIGVPETTPVFRPMAGIDGYFPSLRARYFWRETGHQAIGWCALWHRNPALAETMPSKQQGFARCILCSQRV